MSSSFCSDQSTVPSLESLPQAAQTTAKKQSYGQILKSSALIGGSSVLNIAIRIVRTKAMAVLLGPAGFGLFGLYGSIAELTQSIAGMGINSSGVRQIAEAVGSDDTERIAQTTSVLRRTSIVLGALGAVLLVVFSRQVSTLTFGSQQPTSAVCLLSIAVFFSLVSAGQGALIQGMRRIADFAKMGVLSALYGTFISIPVVYFFREKGVVPSLVGVAAMSIITSWWYSRRVRIPSPSMTASQVGQEAAALLKLGLAFMASGLMMMGVAYAVRTIILRKIGVEATGLYQSAWTLGGLYVGFILQAMGVDFYPRLTASASDNPECNRLVNEQTLVGLLLAGPGVIATLTFAPLVIALFYSAKFGAADMSRSHPAGDYLVNGLHYRGKGQPEPLFLGRSGLDCRRCQSRMGLRRIFRCERCRHCVLCIVRFSRLDDLPHRALAQRLSLVPREQANGLTLPLFDRGGVLRVLRTANPFGGLRWDIGGNSEWFLLAPSSPQTHLFRPDSTSHAAIARRIRLCSFRFYDSQLTSTFTGRGTRS